MSIKSRNVLKTYFENGDIPDQNDFSDLIDSSASLSGNNTSVGNWDITGSITVVGGVSANGILNSSSGNSEDWSSTYTIVNTNSATWGGGGSPTDLSEVAAASGDWNNVWTQVNSLSDGWALSGGALSGSFGFADSVDVEYEPISYTPSTSSISGHLQGI